MLRLTRTYSVLSHRYISGSLGHPFTQHGPIIKRPVRILARLTRSSTTLASLYSTSNHPDSDLTQTMPAADQSAMASTVSTAPPSALARNIVILLDGTGNQFSSKNSNLIKTMSVLKVDETQLTYYSSGLGTILPSGSVGWPWFRQKGAELVDEGLAWNFDQFVCDAYQFCMDNVKSNDRIYIFGFSRGAYTARALAGMIQKVGLLPPGNHNQIKLAYEVYTNSDKFKSEVLTPAPPKPGHPASTAKEKDPAVLYRRIFGISRAVNIEFLGVWDTVASLGGLAAPDGILITTELPFAGGVKSVKFFRQALALDERRAKFQPEYLRLDAEEKVLRDQVKAAQDALDSFKSDANEAARAKAMQTVQAARAKLQKEYPDTERHWKTGASIRKSVECWFMGCHSDVGGGNTENDQPSLSNIPYRWMLREATRCGLLLDPCSVSLQSVLHIPHGHALDPSFKDTTIAALEELGDLLEAQQYDSRKELEQVDQITRLSVILTQDELIRVADLVAQYDSDMTRDDLSLDIVSPIHESLTIKWYVPEILFLQSKKYTADGDKEMKEWRFNNGEGRQIVPGQKIHRSLLRRFQYEVKNASTLKRGDRYGGPAAHPAEKWPEWEDVKSGKAKLDDSIWED